MDKGLVKTSDKKPVLALAASSLAADFLASLDVKEISKKAYKNGLDRFLSWMEGARIEQPDRVSILAFKKALVEFGLSANTVNSYLVAVKRFFTYLEGIRKYPNIARDVKGLRQPRGHLRESLTIDQVREVLSKIKRKTEDGKRDYALINLMARTGLRTIEVIRADIGDIKQEGGAALLYVQGKGRDEKDDFVLLTEAALKPLRAYLRIRGTPAQDQPLFSSLSDRNRGGRLTTKTIRAVIKNKLRKIDIDSPKLSAHSLRHFFATQSLKAGAPLIQVKEALRHSSIETTQKYIHNLERIEKGAERYIEF